MKTHMALSVRGALKNRSFDGFTDDNGREMGRKEVEDLLWQHAQQGHEMFPMGDCDNWDWKTGCKGHQE